MRFKDIVFKNIRKNIKKYLSYFNSAFFCCFMFVMYISLALNDAFGSSSLEDDKMPLKLFFIVSVIAILVFSVFFVSYANNSFMKCRSKEFGTYEVLGMDTHKLAIMVLLETTIINILSILSGILVGGLFSKLFQMIVLRILDINTIHSSINPLGFLITFLVFVVVLFSISIFSVIKLGKKDIEGLMKSERKKEAKSFSNVDIILMFIGLVLLAISFILLGSFASNVSVNTKPLFLISYFGSTFIGVITLSYFGIKGLIYLIKKSKSYKKNLLVISKLEYKHKSNAKMILILSILAAMIVLCVGAPLSLVSLSETIAVTGSADIEYMTYNDHEEDKEAISEIIDNIKIEELTDTFAYVYLDETPIIIEPISKYNSEYKTNHAVGVGHVIISITTWIPGSLGFNNGSVVRLSGKNSVDLYVDKAEKMNFFSNNLFPTKTVFLVNDSDYDELFLETQVVEMHKISISNWKESSEAIERLEETLVNGTSFSRLGNYTSLKMYYQSFFFVSASLAFMFFISTGCVTYFKMHNELDEEKKNFFKLYKIGISNKEIKKIINSELAFVYFSPLLFGGILGLSIMFYMTNIFSFGSDTSFVATFMLRGFFAWLIYVLFQFVFFFITKLKYQKEVLSIGK